MHGRFTPSAAIRIAGRLAAFDPAWLEEPVLPGNPRSLAKVAAAVDVPLRGGIGSRSYAPASAADIPLVYRLAIGHQSIDLTGLDLAGKAVQVTSSVGVGEVHVEVPSNVRVVVRGRAGTGDVDIDLDDASGTQVDRTIALPATAPATAGEIDLDLRVGVGRVIVDREDTP